AANELHTRGHPPTSHPQRIPPHFRPSSETDTHPPILESVPPVRRGGGGEERRGGPLWPPAAPHPSNLHHKQFPPATIPDHALSEFLYLPHSRYSGHSPDSAESNALQIRARGDHGYQSASHVQHRPRQ